ncbi:MAG: pyruvate, phosphate dikinase [Nitrososphaerales archaeon]
MKRIYFFDEGITDRKLLGGKGAGLAEMTLLGLPVPPGFTITTEVCEEFYAKGEKLPEGLMDEVKEAMGRLEKITGKKFGDDKNPLLVSVRSGAAISMPGMMDTVLNLGLNDKVAKGLIEATKDERFVYDTYRRFVQLYGKIVLGVNDELFSKTFEEVKRDKGVKYDHELDAETLKEVVKKFKQIVLEQKGKPFPEEPYEQLKGAIEAVFRSWNGRRCVDYRRQFNITPDIANGTAVNVVTMVYGNMGNDSSTGVLFTRDPATGDRELYGEYLVNAQGEDVVAGIRTPKPISELKKDAPELYREIERISRKLEEHFKEPQDLEFTVERGKLYILQTRNAKMNASALVKTSVDMCKEGLIDKYRALMRIKPDDLDQLLHPRVDPNTKVNPIAQGIAASPGAAKGKVVFDADKATELGKKGEDLILVREETKPEDIHGFFASKGILTVRGGKTSHAAVVARGMGKPCITGCSALEIDYERRIFKVEDKIVREGEVITIDGTTGSVYLGSVPTIEPELKGELYELLTWADEIRRLGVRANADTPEASEFARKMGAEGIGLCRTERMFNEPDRLPLVVNMIMADNEKERREALEKLLPLQRQDFIKILKTMEGYPVTIRLLDPPLHEFLPRYEELLNEVMELEISGNTKELEEKKRILNRVKVLTEINPMLGHRGVRVGITYPEIYEMQIRAICEASAELLKQGVEVKPQVMVPQVGMANELKKIREIFEKVKREVEEVYHFKLPIKFGTMIEVVRACLTAKEIAKVTDFFSFGTNDLTQATFSFSREDAENKFLPLYLNMGILKHNPFNTLDEEGVGRLMDIAVKEGKLANKELEIGICGEHGGDPSSIELCDKIGLDYVSASPYRIPIARLAAAQSVIKKEKVKALAPSGF